MVMLYMLAEFDALQAVFTGGLIGTLLGVLLSLTVCRPQTAAADLASMDKPAVRYAEQAAERRAAPASAPASATAPTSASAPASAAAPVMRAPAPEAEEPAKAAPTPAPAAKTAPTPAPAAKTTPAPAPKATPAAKTAPAVSSSDVPGRTTNMLSAPRAGGADDLKLIGGVGPKLEQTLNELGVYHFDQVANFDKDDIAWVDGNLRFKGRIERDDWMSQARILAAGGETEFSKKKKT